MDTWIRPLDHLENSTPLVTPLEPGQGGLVRLAFFVEQCGSGRFCPGLFFHVPGNQSRYTRSRATDDWTMGTMKSTVRRQTERPPSLAIAHTYSTARNGFWSTPRGNVSQDGRFFMFTSDWEDQLGRMPNGDKYRTDVLWSN